MKDATKPPSPDETLQQGDFYPPNRLAELLNMPGGISTTQALKQAQATINAGETGYLQRIDSALADLRRLGTAATVSLDDQAHMYDRSSEILALSVTVSYRDLSDAAFCLCELLDNQRQKAVWHADRVKVFLLALAMLRKPATDKDSGARAALIAGLKKLAKLD